MPKPPPLLTIGQLAARTGIATSAIRFYESKGLITPLRTESGQRRFVASDVRRISFILITQQLGFSLATFPPCPKGAPPRDATGNASPEDSTTSLRTASAVFRHFAIAFRPA